MSETSRDLSSDPQEATGPVARPGTHAEPKGSFEKGTIEESCWF